VKREVELTIFGLGNALAGDDGVGERVIERLSAMSLPDGVRIEHVAAPGPELVVEIEREGEVWFVDAARDAQRPAGSIVRAIAPPDGEPPIDVAGRLVSTHGFSLAELLRLASALGRRRAVVRIWAVVGETFEAGASLSRAASEAVGVVADEIAREVRSRGALESQSSQAPREGAT
jgi:hydrogenase maturation protease